MNSPFTMRLLSFFITGFFAMALQAVEMSSMDAETVVRGYLRINPKPFGATIGHNIKSVEVIRDVDGSTLFYQVDLVPDGFILVSADDHVDPIIAVCEKGHYRPVVENPLHALASRDLHARMTNIKAGIGAKAAHELSRNGRAIPGSAQRWEVYKNAEMSARQANPTGLEKAAISVSPGPATVLVPAFITSEWNQNNDVTSSPSPTWNLATPNNYVCGCVATAVAQAMYYYQWPTTAVGTPLKTFKVDGQIRNQPLWGGDGIGGAYNWPAMVGIASSSTAYASRLAMSFLCADVGFATDMSYTQDQSATRIVPNVALALTGTFGYSNARAVYTIPQNTLLSSTRVYENVRANLYCGLPVIFGIFGSSSGRDAGHAIVCGGLGNDSGEYYYWLNFGWGGQSNAWYTLPDIGAAGDYNYGLVSQIACNIFPSGGGGEIVSGMVVDTSSSLVSGANVTLTISSTPYTTTTNTNGVWYFYHVPSASTMTVTASYGGLTYPTLSLTTGTSINGSTVAFGDLGNVEVYLHPIVPVPPVITSALSASVSIGQNFVYSIVANNSPTSYTASGLPAGLAINILSGVITGRPTVTGTFSSTISAINGAGSDSQTLIITVSPPPIPVVTIAGAVNGMVGAVFVYQITASNTPTSYGASGLPAGLTVDSTDGLISGEPTVAGTYSVLLSATNAGGTGSGTLSLVVAPTAVGLTWTMTGSLSVARDSHAAVIAGTKILSIGGYDQAGAPLASVESYASGLWTATGSLTVARGDHGAVTLNDGSVLVFGGSNGTSSVSSCERWTPATGLWTLTGSMTTARKFFSFVKLSDGRVLVCGGDSGTSTLASSEIYNPATGIWSPTGSMSKARSFSATILLGNNQVLVCGGANGSELSSTEIYNPSTGLWVATGGMIQARDSHAITLLSNGRVLVAGGFNLVGATLGGAEVFDPSSGTWALTGSLLVPRGYASFVPVGSGRYLLAGGLLSESDAQGVLTYTGLGVCELYNETSGTWSGTLSMNKDRFYHAVLPLSANSALAIGGLTDVAGVATDDATSEIYTIAPAPTPSPGGSSSGSNSSGGCGLGSGIAALVFLSLSLLLKSSLTVFRGRSKILTVDRKI